MDQGSEGILSPFLRKQRFRATAPYLKGRVLDYGCGCGELARVIPPERYLGIDIDADAVQAARVRFPQHNFLTQLPDENNKFDVIILMAVIEHVKDPAAFLKNLSLFLTGDSESNSQIVVTTPHPSVDWVHSLGAQIGLFSKHANEEHEELLGRDKLKQTGCEAGLKIIKYQRFLFGANQLAIFQK